MDCSGELPPGPPNHQLVGCLVPERQRKVVAVISLGPPLRPRRPPGEGCSEQGMLPIPEVASLDRRHNRHPVREGGYLGRNPVQTLNLPVPSLVRLRPSSLRPCRSLGRAPRPNPNQPSQVYLDSRQGDSEGLGEGFWAVPCRLARSGHRWQRPN